MSVLSNVWNSTSGLLHHLHSFFIQTSCHLRGQHTGHMLVKTPPKGGNSESQLPVMRIPHSPLFLLEIVCEFKRKNKTTDNLFTGSHHLYSCTLKCEVPWTHLCGHTLIVGQSSGQHPKGLFPVATWATNTRRSNYLKFEELLHLLDLFLEISSRLPWSLETDGKPIEPTEVLLWNRGTTIWRRATLLDNLTKLFGAWRPTVALRRGSDFDLRIRDYLVLSGLVFHRKYQLILPLRGMEATWWNSMKIVNIQNEIK